MLSWKIAWRYLFARKSHTAVNVISAVSMGGVAVAAAAMVCVLSVFNGFADLADKRTSALSPVFSAVPARGKVIAGADSIALALMKIPGVETAAPLLDEHGVAILGDRQMAVRLRGVTEAWRHTTAIDSKVIDGYFTAADVASTTTAPDNESTVATAPPATLSVGAAVRLNGHPDWYSRLQVHVPQRLGRINAANPMNAFRSDTLMITGVYQVENQDTDADYILLPIERLRQMLDYTNAEATSIAIAATPEARTAIAQALGPQIQLLDRLQQNEASYRMIAIEKWISFLMLVFILVIASFNIISTMSMLIIEKEESIVILTAMGARKRLINNIFVIEGRLISLFGGIIGIVLGTGLTLAQQYGGFIKLGGDPTQHTIDVYPVRVAPADLLLTLAVVAVVGLLTGLVTLAISKRRK